jgi:hypothetical protein
MTDNTSLPSCASSRPGASAREGAHDGCPACGGSGRQGAGVQGFPPQGIVCDDCDGTGDYLRACVRRAYERGVQAGIDAMRAAQPVPPPRPPWDALARPL